MGSNSALAEVIEVKSAKTKSKKTKVKRSKSKSPAKKKKKAPHLTKAEMDKIIVEHREHGVRLAWSFLTSWRIRLHQDEVTSVVGAALCEAAIRFDPNRGVEFRTFFFYHLRGMLLKEISQVIQEQKILTLVPNHVLSGSTSSETPNYSNWIAPIVDRNNPERLLEKREVAQRCWEACAELDVLEQEVLIRYFVNDESLIDIAKDLDYCRCHISRVKSRALKKLGTLLSDFTTSADGTIDELRRAKLDGRNSVRRLKKYTGGRGRRGKESQNKEVSVALKKLIANG